MQTATDAADGMVPKTLTEGSFIEGALASSPQGPMQWPLCLI